MARRYARQMARGEQIRKALKLLAPLPEKRAECRSDIENALGWIEFIAKGSKAFQAMRSPKAKRTLAAFHKIMRQALVAYDKMFAAGNLGSPEERGWICQLIELSKPPKKRVTYYALSQKPIPEIIPDGTALSVGPGKQSSATEAAHELLTKWRAGIKIVSTREDDWHKLAAILYGDEGADLYQYLRIFVRP